MFVILIRVIIIFIIVLALIRLMGKRQIGELQPFELVITLIVADVATLPMSEPTTPLINGLIPLLALVILQYFLSFLSRKSVSFRKLINGKPVIVIDSNGIVYENLKALNMSINDLQEALRGCGVTNFDMVQYAIIETNGKASVILSAKDEPPTREDLKVSAHENTLPVILVCEGKLNEENIKLTKLTEQNITDIIKNEGIKTIKNILVMNIDNNGKIYLQENNKKGKTIEYKNFDGGENW